jgi:S1-C subfamily serine protease
MRRLPAATVVVLLAAVAIVLGLSFWAKRNQPANPDRVLSIVDRPARQVSNQGGGPNFVEAAKKLEPAVVAIMIAKVVNTMVGPRVSGALGSGVIISPDGYIVTNAHVVNDADSIRVRTVNGREFQGYVVGKDVRNDIAVVKVNGARLPYAELGDSSAVQVGEWVMAIGNPYGLENTLTVGVVSALRRVESDAGPSDMIQTDAAINQGNSGGALANIAGQVIGINEKIESMTGGNVGLGFAIPINLVKKTVKMIVQHQRIPIPYVGIAPTLGIELSDPDVQRRFRDVTGVASVPDHGIIVDAVSASSPAGTAGIQRFDVILAIGGKRIQHPEDLRAIIRQSQVGAQLSVTIWRDGRETNVKLTVADMPDSVRQRQFNTGDTEP